MALSLRSFTIQRAGVSNWRVLGSHHCGPKEYLVGPANAKAIPVRWNAIVECAPRLDDRGFLFDQASVGRYMDALAEIPTDMSCERLAHHVAERLLAKIEKVGCVVRRLRLEFSPAPYAASITVEFA